MSLALIQETLTDEELAEFDLLDLETGARAGTGGPPSPDSLPHPADWIEEHFYIPELRGPISLAPYQRAVLNESQRRDDQQNLIYSIVLWSDIKKSAKSCMAAAMALYKARHVEWGNISIVANDLKQANSRVSYYFRRALELHPDHEKGRTYRERYNSVVFDDLHTTVEAIPIDPAGEAGGNDDLIIFSELWAAKNKAIQQMWTEMTLSPTKFGQSQRWIETYAGYQGESPILEMLYEQGIAGERLDLSFDGHDLADLEVYAAGPLLMLWNTRPRQIWQTPEYYAAEAVAQTPNEFNRIHKNEWATSGDAFVPPEWWDARRVDMPPLDAKEPLVLALDAGVSDDCFGMVGVTRHNNGQVDFVRVRYARKWDAPKNGKIIYSNPEDKNDRETPEGEVRWLCREYNVICVAFDEYQLHDFCSRLRLEGIAYFKIFQQGKARAIADKSLYDAIKGCNIEHGGDAALTEHVKNANKVEQGENKLRLVKRSAALKIDLAVSLSMAHAMARKFNL